MCLILFAWQAHPRYALVAAANRDEFHARPTAAAEFWPDEPGLLAGRDLQAGGTWLGITRTGRFAAITNYREHPEPEPPPPHSRGRLVRDFLAGTAAPLPHAESLARDASLYSGYNLLLGAPGELAYCSNRGAGPVAIEPGCHGLSNHLLDTDWPKVHAGRTGLERLLEQETVPPEALFALLTDRKLQPGDWPRDVDRSLVEEQLANHCFIVSPRYGTRSSTVLLIGHDGRMEFLERQFDPQGVETSTRRFEFRIV